MMLLKKHERIIGNVLLGICIFLTAVSVFLCFSPDIWYDELFTMGFTERPTAELLSLAVRDVHPPLYYLIVKLGVTVGVVLTGPQNTVAMAKIISIIPFAGLMVYGMTRVRRNFGILTAGLFCFLVYTMPQLSQYTVEIRMYGYCMFFITAGMLHAYEIQQKMEMMVTDHSSKPVKGWVEEWVSMTMYLIAAAYSHYYAFVAAVMIYLYLLIHMHLRTRRLFLWNMRKIWAAWGLSAVGGILAYLPWLTAVVRQMGKVKEEYWILPLTWRSIFGCIKFLFMPSFSNGTLNTVVAVLLIIVAGGVLFWALWLQRKRETTESLFLAGCLSILGGVVAFGFAASFLFRPVFVYRYMLPAMGVFWLSFAIALGRLCRKKHIFYLVLMLYLVTGLRNYRAFYGEEMWKRVQMRHMETEFETIQSGDILIFNFNHTQGVVHYYLQQKGMHPETVLYEAQPEQLIKEMFGAAGMADERRLEMWLQEGKTVWFIGSGNAREELRADWAGRGIRTEEAASCLLERYWFNLYHVSLNVP